GIGKRQGELRGRTGVVGLQEEVATAVQARRGSRERGVDRVEHVAESRRGRDGQGRIGWDRRTVRPHALNDERIARYIVRRVIIEAIEERRGRGGIATSFERLGRSE